MIWPTAFYPGRVHIANLQSHWAANKPAKKTVVHHQAFLCPCALELEHVKVWRRCRERYVDCSTDWVRTFGGGGSVVV